MQSMEEKTGAPAGKFLTFRLGAEEYGLGILKVREIIGLTRITRVPRAPEFVRGVINLRGKVIPVLDLRRRFGMPGMPDSPQNCIIVVEKASAEGVLAVGALVDSVSEVRNIEESNSRKPPLSAPGSIQGSSRAWARARRKW